MNILFLTLVKFDNINTQGIYTDLIREFRDRGHNVSVVQPLEKRYGLNTHFESNENISILSVKIGNITKTNIVEKGISTVTLQNRIIHAIKKYYNEINFDLILYSTPPITFSKVVKYIKSRDNAKSYLMLKDIFPQNALDINLLSKKNPIYWYFRKKEKTLYKISDYIGCMSQKNIVYLLKNNKNLEINNIEICPNSIKPIDFNIDQDSKERIRKEFGLPLDKIVFIYGGNLGKPQGIDFVIECLKENENNLKTYILIVGNGTEYSKLKKFFDDYRPQNSSLITSIENDKYELLVSSCDVGLIFLDRRFTIPNFPSRLLSYMQASIPVLAATDSNTDLGEIIQENNFGVWCESKDVYIFNVLLNEMCSNEKRIYMGKNAREYLVNNFTSKHSYQIIMTHFGLRED